jgi:hypothetical protein
MSKCGSITLIGICRKAFARDNGLISIFGIFDYQMEAFCYKSTTSRLSRITNKQALWAAELDHSYSGYKKSIYTELGSLEIQ